MVGKMISGKGAGKDSLLSVKFVLRISDLFCAYCLLPFAYCLLPSVLSSMINDKCSMIDDHALSSH
jgi:hypothetical protein